MINDIIKQQVNNFKRFLEKEQKNLLLVKTDRNGEIVMPTMDELLRFDTTGIQKNAKK